MIDQLKAIIRLQHIDTKIDKVEKLRGDLPDEIRDLEDEKAGLETRIAKFEQEKMESEIGRRKAEMDITDCEALIKKYGEQQLQVRNNREYDALTKEIEAQNQFINESKVKIQQLELRDSANEAALSETQKSLKSLKSVLKGKQKDLDSVLQETADEIDALKQVREDALTQVEDRYRNAYVRLRTRMRDGRAVVPLQRGAAGGYQVPPQRQVEIRQRNRIIVCEHTGRIIVDDDLFIETSEQLAA